MRFAAQQSCPDVWNFAPIAILHRHLRLTQHNVEYACGKARFFRQLRERERRERCFMRGLNDRRATHRECGSGLAGDHRDPEIPRCNKSGNADWFHHHARP